MAGAERGIAAVVGEGGEGSTSAIWEVAEGGGLSWEENGHRNFPLEYVLLSNPYYTSERIRLF